MKFIEAKGPQHTGHIWASPMSHIGRIIEGTGTYYEADLLTAIALLAREGVYIDVGAHVGNHTAFFTLECPSTRVIALEPSRAAVEALRKTVAGNPQAEKVEVMRAAIHDSWESANAIATEDGRRTIRPGGGNAPCHRLDDLVQPPERVAVIKVDVDGLEPNVLMSGAKIIQRDWPILALEAWSPETLEETRGVLEPWGYVRGKRYCRTPTYLWAHGD